MRNGNTLYSFLTTFDFARSYPTYEEWKLKENLESNSLKLTCSYPTYEEWKQASLHDGAKPYVRGSYPTYEEWKLYLLSLPSDWEVHVLILPMRNGNR